MAEEESNLESAGAAPSAAPACRAHCALRICTAALALTVLIGWVLGSLLEAPYLFDDRSVILENRALQSGTPLAGWFWQPHPVRYLTLLADRMAGFDPTFGHGVNLVLHGFVSMLVWLVFRSCTTRRWLAPVVAVAFALNPLVIEAVGIVTHRKDVLAAFFVLLGIHCSTMRRSQWMLWPCWILAFFSKETAIVLPALWLIHRLGVGGGALKETIGAHKKTVFGFCVLGLALAVAGWQVAALRPASFGGGDGMLREATNVLAADTGWLVATVEAAGSFLRYLVHLVLPLPRSIDPPVWNIAGRSGWIQGAVIAGALGVLKRRSVGGGEWWPLLPLCFLGF